MREGVFTTNHALIRSRKDGTRRVEGGREDECVCVCVCVEREKERGVRVCVMVSVITKG
jgi:hypothetical protein